MEPGLGWRDRQHKSFRREVVEFVAGMLSFIVWLIAGSVIFIAATGLTLTVIEAMK